MNPANFNNLKDMFIHKEDPNCKVPNKYVPPFVLFSDNGSNLNDVHRTTIRNQIEETPLRRLFFSKQNIDNIQKQIQIEVYERSNSKFSIDRQSDTELEVIMRSYYLQYGRNLPCKLIEQVQQLNKMVLDYCIPNVLGEVSSYIKYKRDIFCSNNNGLFLDKPKHTRMSKQLQPNHFIQK